MEDGRDVVDRGQYSLLPGGSGQETAKMVSRRYSSHDRVGLAKIAQKGQSCACKYRSTYRSNRRMVTSVAVNADISCCCVAVFPAVIALFPTC
jgi:hypothetical protein